MPKPPIQSCKNVQTVQTSRCYFFWPVLIFGKSTRKTGENTQKQAKNSVFLVLIFLWEKLVGANFYAFCNYAAGVDAPPRREKWFPSPPRPIKIIKTAGKLQGKIKAQISTFSIRGNQWRNNITTLNNAQSSLSIGIARESKKWKYLFLPIEFLTLFGKICQRMK